MKLKSKDMKLLLYLFLFGFVTLSCDNDEIDYENEEVQADYEEKYRPQIHFTAEKNWINDPTGWFILMVNIIFLSTQPIGN